MTHTVGNLMALHNAASHAAVQYALLAQVSLRSERTLQAADDRDEANDVLRTALEGALAAQPAHKEFQQTAMLELYEFQQLTECDSAEQYRTKLAAQPVREPLTDDVIFEIACGAADEMWPDVGGVGWTKDDAKFYGIFCKKIERAHGIGEEK